MLKKFLIVATIFCLITFMSSFVFATNMLNGAENLLNDAGSGIHNMVNDTANTVNNAKNGIVNMMDDMGNDDTDNYNVEDDMTRDYDNAGTAIMNTEDNDGYTATRTSSANNLVTANNTVVWTVLAVVALIIVALVWYYGTQTDNRSNH